MFTEEQRSWRLPDELIWVRLFFICFLDFCSETRTAAADGSVKQTLSGCCSRHGPGGSPPLHLCTLSQASWGAGLLRSLICLTRYVFSSLNCSSSVLSFWNLLRNSMSLVWFFSRMSRMGCVLLGLATNTW